MKKFGLLIIAVMLFASIEACKGPQGDVGPQGQQGLQGEKGVQGDPGMKVYYTAWKQYTNWTDLSWDYAYKNIELPIEANIDTDIITVQMIAPFGELQTLPCNGGFQYRNINYDFEIRSSKTLRINVWEPESKSIIFIRHKNNKFRIIIMRLTGNPNLRKAYSPIEIDEIIKNNGLKI